MSLMVNFHHSHLILGKYHENYKTDEKILKNIITSNTLCTDPNSRLNLIIYYKNGKTSNLVMKNNLAPPVIDMHKPILFIVFAVLLHIE